MVDIAANCIVDRLLTCAVVNATTCAVFMAAINLEPILGIWLVGSSAAICAVINEYI